MRPPKLFSISLFLLLMGLTASAFWLQSCGGGTPSSPTSATSTPTATGTVTSTGTTTPTVTVTPTPTPCTGTVSGTFGQATGTQSYTIAGNSYAAPFTAPATGNAWQVVMPELETVASPGNIRVGIYSDNSGPDQLLSSSDNVVPPASPNAGSVTFALPPVHLVGGQVYWFAFGIPTDGTDIGFPDANEDGASAERAAYSVDLPTNGTWNVSNVLAAYTITYCQ